jgi:hypothetical protein
MNWDAIGAIGELIGASAVVATLAYLAYQTRENTHALKSQTRSSITDQVLNIQTTLFQTPPYLEAMRKVRDGGTLNESESIYLNMEALMYFKHMENAQFQYEKGLYDKDEYLAQRRTWIKRFDIHPAWSQAWDQFKSDLSPRLVREIEELLRERKSE